MTNITPNHFRAYGADGMDAKDAILANAATRAAHSLSQWHGHMLAPATRKADRQVTYETMLRDVVFAVLLGSGIDFDRIDTTAKRILAEFAPATKGTTR